MGSDEVSNLCAKCDKKLGLRKFKPREDWQYQGKLCKDCNDFVTANSPYYEVEYKEGYPPLEGKLKGILTIHNFDDRKRVLFYSKDNHKIEIPIQTIQSFDTIDYEEDSTKRKIATMGISKKSSSKHLKISFLDDSDTVSPIFHLQEIQAAKNSISLLLTRFKKETQNAKPSENMIEAVKNATGQNLVDDSSFGKLVDRHGEINKIMKYLEPEETVLFVTRQSRLKPGGSAITTPNTIFATEKRLLIRNPSMLGMRSSVEDIPYDSISTVKLQVGIFSSTLLFTGPGFGEVNRMSKSSLTRAWGRGEEGAIDAIPKKEAEELYKIIKKQMELKKGHKVSFTQIVNQNPATESVQIKTEEDPITILKKRLAKGEITKEEYEDLKKMLE